MCIYIYVLCLLKAVTLRRYNTRLPEDPEGVFVHELGPSQLCGDIELACFVVAVVATLPKTCSNMLKSKSSTTTEQIWTNVPRGRIYTIPSPVTKCPLPVGKPIGYIHPGGVSSAMWIIEVMGLKGSVVQRLITYMCAGVTKNRYVHAWWPSIS